MKAQVTAFIILGMVIVAIGITLYTFRQQIFSATFGGEIEESIVVPQQAERAKLYVDACLESIILQGVNLLSAQGGYIEVPLNEVPTLINPFSNTLDIFGTGVGQVVYWFTETENGIQKNQMPTKQQMETALAGYIDDNLQSCLNDFRPLRNQGYTFTEEQPRSRVVINEENVIVQTDYPVTMQKEDFSFSFNRFRKTVKSKVGKLYNTAVELMQKESTAYFFEERALDMMAVYDAIPFSGIDTECTPRTWLKSNVQKELKKIFALNFPTLRIEGSRYRENERDHKSFIIDALSKKTDATILFSYQETWPLLMDVVGENDEVLRGKPFTLENEASRFLLPLFCLNDNHFVYDLKFPMLISLQEDDSMFQFATLVVIDNNQPRENRVTPVLISPQIDICENPGKELTIVAATYKPDGSILELPDVHISFKCLEQVCDQGETEPRDIGAVLTTIVPQCSDGTLIAEKPGFHRGETTVSTNTAEGEMIVYLEPVKEVAVEVKVFDQNQERAPYATEQIIFTFENVEQKYTTTLLYPTQKTVKLIPGDYVIRSQIIVENAGGFSFPEKEIEICNDVPQQGVLGVIGLTTRKCTKQKIDATEFNQIIGGGSVTSWSIQRATLAEAQKVTLYTQRLATPRSIEEVGKVYEAIQRSQTEVKKPVLQ